MLSDPFKGSSEYLLLAVSWLVCVSPLDCKCHELKGLSYESALFPQHLVHGARSTVAEHRDSGGCARAVTSEVSGLQAVAMEMCRILERWLIGLGFHSESSFWQPAWEID